MVFKKPVMLLNKQQVLRNIEKIAKKAKKSNVEFRPHFKIHQSAVVGSWFKDFGVNKITVSSVDMANYFADAGWNDICIAFPVNILQIDEINALAKRVTLNLLVESLQTATFLDNNLSSKVDIWLKIDTGNHRTGIPSDNYKEITDIASYIKNSKIMVLKGVLTHSGNTYEARSTSEITKIYNDSVKQLRTVRDELKKNNIDVLISIGDTPSCSVVEDFTGVNEIRPGCFVFYDLAQTQIGSCKEEEIAMVVTCPVVAKHRSRNEIIVYGGAVHLSKASMTENNVNIYGKVALLNGNKWGHSLKNTYVKNVEQEHGIIKVNDSVFDEINIGDVLAVLPVHANITVASLKQYTTGKETFTASLL